MAVSDWYLNGTKLCPWNFSWSESQEVIGDDVRLLNGLLRRDTVARKLNVGLSWELLEETFNGTHHGYSDLRALGTNSGTMKLLRPVGTSTGTQAFNVYVDPPSGEVAFRSTGTVFWDCGVRLREA